MVLPLLHQTATNNLKIKAMTTLSEIVTMESLIKGFSLLVTGFEAAGFNKSVAHSMASEMLKNGTYEAMVIETLKKM